MDNENVFAGSELISLFSLGKLIKTQLRAISRAADD